MRDTLQQQRSRPPSDHRIILDRKGIERRLEEDQVTLAVPVKPIPESRFTLFQACQFFLLHLVAPGRFENDLTVDKTVAQPFSHSLADLGAAAAHLTRDHHETHDCPPCGFSYTDPCLRS